MTHSDLYIGLMSGTSVDGVDGVLADFSGGAIVTVHSAFIAFAPPLRAALLALQAAGPNELERESLAANALAASYAACVAALLPAAPAPVRAVAVHGQTVRHRPELGFTRQTNNAALLAELTGLDVIADFRSRDVAAGGQGAPLVPAFHRAAFGLAGQTRVVVNLGGIANISVLHADGAVDGFDTGPGNVLLDLWIGRHLGQDYDADGAWGAGGKVDAELLDLLLDEPYFAQAAPKSTGRDLFHGPWLDARLTRCTTLPAPRDVQATLVRLTALTVARAIGATVAHADAVYVCGGGAYNSALLGELAAALGAGMTAETTIKTTAKKTAQTTVETTAALGVAPNQVEALAFAWLGYRFTRRETGNLPAVTGAAGARILGALYPA